MIPLVKENCICQFMDKLNFFDFLTKTLFYSVEITRGSNGSLLMLIQDVFLCTYRHMKINKEGLSPFYQKNIFDRK